jgi:hypothetical protein
LTFDGQSEKFSIVAIATALPNFLAFSAFYRLDDRTVFLLTVKIKLEPGNSGELLNSGRTIAGPGPEARSK